MKPSQVIKLGVWDIANSEFVDITNGVISIDTKTGSDSFEGFWDQPDTGQFAIVTRGDTSDPNLNPLITANSLLTITIGDANSASSERILYGFITDVNVKYNKSEKQIVTINGTDLIGYLNRLILTDDFINDNITPTYPTALVPVDYLLQYCVYLFDPVIKNFFTLQYVRNADFSQLSGAGGIFSTTPPTPLVKVEPGLTIYELISSGMSTGLIRSECQYGRDYFFMPYYKYDSTFYDDFWDNYYEINAMHFIRTNETDPWQSDYEPDTTSIQSTYRAINLSNGLDRTINTVVVNNTDPANGDFFTSDPTTDNQSIIDYGPAKLDSSTGFTTTTNPFWLPSSTVAGQAQEYADNIIDWQSQPETIIDVVTIDMAKYYMYASEEEFVVAPDNGSRMFVQHKLTDGTYISGYYVVCGVRHRITESEWLADFILRKSEYEFIKDNRPKKPEILLNTDTGTTATTFNASIDNYTSEDWDNVESVEWMVNYPSDLLNDRPNNRPSETFNTIMGLNLPIFTSNTVSWTYDDGGVLENYYIPLFEFLLNGPGNYNVLVWVKYKNGLTTISEAAYVAVTSAEAYADFGFSKNASEQVTFVDLSGADTNTWDWDFGDGTTYSGKTPPVKEYATSGTFNVTLTVDNGYDTSSVTKPVTINIYQIPVQYIRLRYQGTVTKAAGAEDYTTDLIDTIGLVELKNTLLQQTGGIQPMYFSRIGTLDKVEDIGKGQISTQAYAYNPLNPYTVITELGPIDNWQCPNPEDPLNPFDVTSYTYYNRESIAPVTGPYESTNYTPYYTTNYASGGPLDPMSQSMRSSWNSSITRGTFGGEYPKYKFHPVITNNPDGSQTKSIDVDIIVWYSQTYINATSSSSTSSAWRNWFTNRPAYYSAADDPSNAATINGGLAYLPAGTPSRLQYWSNWGPGGSAYDERLKLKEIKIWPGKEISIADNSTKSFFLPGNPLPNCTQDAGGLSLSIVNKIGVTPEKTYLPITISVSDDGVTYRKVAEATYTSGSVMETTYTASMPPYSSAPVEA